MIISIDGVDGAGKSTVIKLLLERLTELNLVSVKTSNRSEMSSELKQFLNENIEKALIARFIYFSYSNLLASNEIKNKNYENVIIDRFVYSTEAYHKAVDRYYYGGIYYELLDHLSKEAEKELITVDVAIFLYVNEKEQMKRLLRKDPQENNKLDFKIEIQKYVSEEFHKIAERLRHDGIFVYELDTSNMDENTVAKKIEEIIKAKISEEDYKREKTKVSIWNQIS